MLRKTLARSPQCPTSDWSSTISQRKVPRRMSSAQRSASLRASICVRCSRLLAYDCASIEDMAEQFPGLTFQGSGSADVDYLLNFLSITNYTDDLLGDSAE